MLDTRSEDEQEAAVVSCPMLRSAAMDELGTFPTGWYCALRQGRRRVPSVDELAWFCTNGTYHACPTYRQEASPTWRREGGAL